MDWTSGLGGVGGRGRRFRGLAVANRRGGPWSGATEEGVGGGGVVRSRGQGRGDRVGGGQGWTRKGGSLAGGDGGQGWTGLRAWAE